jgi:hypothetical protein
MTSRITKIIETSPMDKKMTELTEIFKGIFGLNKIK